MYPLFNPYVILLLIIICLNYYEFVHLDQYLKPVKVLTSFYGDNTTLTTNTNSDENTIKNTITNTNTITTVKENIKHLRKYE